MKKTQHLLLIFLFCVICNNIIAQAPSNDNCSEAITLPVNATPMCTGLVSGTTSRATLSPLPVCTSTADGDIWYKFVATASSHKISVNAQDLIDGKIRNPTVELLSGDCGKLTSIKCNPALNVNSNTFIQEGLVVGQTYFIRLYSQYENCCQGSFTICVTTPYVPNDSFENAISLIVNKSLNCVDTTFGTTIDATGSQAACNGTADDDVWYSFVATSTTHKIVLNPTSSEPIQDPIIELLSGTSNSLTLIKCSNLIDTKRTIFIQQGLTIGKTYYLRVYTYASDASYQSRGAFFVCVSTPVVSNDDCEGAIGLPVNELNECTNKTLGTTLYASQSRIGCSGIADDDVWYSFVANASDQKIEVEKAYQSNIQNPIIEVFSGSCASLTSLQCSDTNSVYTTASKSTLIRQGFIPGVTYYIRIYTKSSNYSDEGAFNICVSKISRGEHCENAIVLVPSNNSTPNYTAGTTSSYLPSEFYQGCAYGGFADVWYKCKITNKKSVLRILPASSQKNPIIYAAVYRGVCQKMKILRCTKDTAVSLADVSVGETIYIQVYSRGLDSGNVFKIAVITDPPLNDECSTAYVLNIGEHSSMPAQFHTTIGATQSFTACNDMGQANDVWYTITSGNEPFNIEMDALDKNWVHSELFTGGCNSLTTVSCQPMHENIISVDSPRMGQKYYLRLFARENIRLHYFIKASKNPPLQANNTIKTACLLPNLVPNPSFETYNSCPTSFVPTPVEAGKALIPGWSFPSVGSTDYFNSCATPDNLIEVPRNYGFGIQSPRTGKGYVGLFVENESMEYREYIQSELPTPMIKGKKYLISYYVNLSDQSLIAIDRLGVYFSTSKVITGTFGALPVTPQVTSPVAQYFSDKDNWVNVSAVFTADESYQYFVIGNFNEKLKTSKIPAKDGVLVESDYVSDNAFSYIYIDDVSLSEIDEVTGDCAASNYVTNFWTGAVSSAWENPLNWSLKRLPYEQDNVVINTGTVVINSNVSIRSLELNKSVNFSINPTYKLAILH